MGMELCTRFINCSAPICSLDEDSKERVRLPGEDKCRLDRVEVQKLRRQNNANMGNASE